ncbi:MAG TPA: TRAP transporter large permease subunit, partial [Pararhizobium sp.]|nr:TRAP transporter large permease subunit [Pararhizobium sp.]
MLIAGMFVDSTTATLLLVPIVAPPVVAAGVDPVQLGLVIIFNLMIGLVTPPVGLCLYAVSSVSNVAIGEIARELWPYLLALVVVLMLVTFVPVLVMWLPHAFGFGPAL